MAALQHDGDSDGESPRHYDLLTGEVFEDATKKKPMRLEVGRLNDEGAKRAMKKWGAQERPSCLPPSGGEDENGWHLALRHRDEPLFAWLMANEYAGINEANRGMATPLHVAAELGVQQTDAHCSKTYAKFVESLIKTGRVNVDSRDTVSGHLIVPSQRRSPNQYSHLLSPLPCLSE